MANRDLTVIASGGDGDGFAIGMGIQSMQFVVTLILLMS